MKTTIYLIRHAEAEGNLYRRIHGQYDSLITPNGYRQIEALQARFASVPIDGVYSSDLLRTRATAAAIYRPHGLELQTRKGLREIAVGEWEDKPWGELMHFDGARMALFHAGSPDWQVAGGETFAQLQDRMVKSVTQIARNNPGKTIAVVSHGTAIRTLQAWLHGLPLSESGQLGHCDNTGVTCLEVSGDRFQVIYENDNSHLTDEISTLARQKWWRSESPANVDANLWFQPLDFQRQEELFYQARREAWITIHGSLENFDGEGFLRDARACSQRDPRSIMLGMLGDRIAGLIHMDLARDAEKGVGAIPFYYMTPEYRHKGLGIQLLGQAVSTYRPLGRRYIRLRCAPDNLVAKRFSEKNGFRKIGQAQGTRVPLDIMEKYIGLDDQSLQA